MYSTDKQFLLYVLFVILLRNMAQDQSLLAKVICLYLQKYPQMKTFWCTLSCAVPVRSANSCVGQGYWIC